MDVETDCPPPSYTNGRVPSHPDYSNTSPDRSRHSPCSRDNLTINGDRSRQPCQPSDTCSSVNNYRITDSRNSVNENSRNNVISNIQQNSDHSSGHNFSHRNDSNNINSESTLRPIYNSTTNRTTNNDNMLHTMGSLSLSETNSSFVFNRPPSYGYANNQQNKIPMQLQNSKYPNFRTMAQRIQSYILSTAPVRNPENMSEAGFFAITNQDFVRCFHCGIGLRNWEEDDDPYVEHCRWSPNCQYMKLKKGQAFIDAVQDAVRQVQLEEALVESETRDGSQDDGSVTYTDIAEDGVNNESYPSSVLKKNPLLCNAAQCVLEMGYLPRVVKKAVDSVLQQHGFEGLTAARIADIVFDMEAKREQVRIPVQQETKKNVNKSRLSEETIKQLKEQNREFKEKILCVICCEADRAITFLPCGHLVCCAQCAPACSSCAVCRQDIKDTSWG